MYKIGVIGDKDSVLGFMSVGFSVFISDNAKTTAGLIAKLAAENFAVIYITEEAASEVTEEIEKYKSSPLPAIILIPGKSGSLGIGMGNIKKSVEAAVGADILFKNN